MSHDWSMKITDTRGRVMTHGREGQRYLDGNVLTPYGIVSAYAQGHGDGYLPSSSYQIIHKGRLYSRQEPVARTRRGLAIMAAKFAKEIAG